MKLGKKTYYKRKADILVSKIVRLQRACVWCHNSKGQLQCAHVIGRSNHTLRFDLKNVICLCATCHRKGHNDPLAFVAWFQKKYPSRFEYIMQNKNRLTKRTALDYKTLVDDLNKIYKLRGGE